MLVPSSRIARSCGSNGPESRPKTQAVYCCPLDGLTGARFLRPFPNRSLYHLSRRPVRLPIESVHCKSIAPSHSLARGNSTTNTSSERLASRGALFYCFNPAIAPLRPGFVSCVGSIGRLRDEGGPVCGGTTTTSQAPALAPHLVVIRSVIRRLPRQPEPKPFMQPALCSAAVSPMAAQKCALDGVMRADQTFRSTNSH